MNDTTESSITPQTIEQAMDYREYRHMIDALLKQGKTTGTNHSEAWIHYTKMNVHRMTRLDKRLTLSETLVDKLDEVEDQWVWLVLTEAWCGDAAQNIPAIARMAAESENITLGFILRDENLDIMDQYLTNGGRSIPKLVCLEAESMEEVGTWGPRPVLAQEKVEEWKNDPAISKKEWAKKLHKWYAKNRAQELQSEFEELIGEWCSN